MGAGVRLPLTAAFLLLAISVWFLFSTDSASSQTPQNTENRKRFAGDIAAFRTLARRPTNAANPPALGNNCEEETATSRARTKNNQVVQKETGDGKGRENLPPCDVLGGTEYATGRWEAAGKDPDNDSTGESKELFDFEPFRCPETTARSFQKAAYFDECAQVQSQPGEGGRAPAKGSCPCRSLPRAIWRPAACRLPKGTNMALRFLDLMRGKTLAFVGDSLTAQQHIALLCWLNAAAPGRSSEAAPFRFHFKAHNFTVLLARTNHFFREQLDRSRARFSLDFDAFETPVVRALKLADFAVVNVGAWFSPIKCKQTWSFTGDCSNARVQRDFESATRRLLDTLPERFPNCRYVFRTQHARRPACVNRTFPSLPEREAFLQETSSQQFATRARFLAREARARGLAVLDVRALSDHRSFPGDFVGAYRDETDFSRPDCLHSCICPRSVLATWNQLLFSLLRSMLAS
jgi:GDSL/SGNH-like Acyl-Esterase family found in Pmr5 and Cas1p